MKHFGMTAGLAAMLLAGTASAQNPYPSPDTPWTADQYVNFYFAHSNGNQALPHLRSPEGQALVARFTDRENVDRILAAPVSTAEKRRQLGIMVMTSGAARGAYSLSLVIGEPLAEEVAEVQAFNLYAIARLASLGGGEASAGAWTTSFYTAAEALADQQLYPPAPRQRLAEAMTAAWPDLKKFFAFDAQQELAARFARLGGQAEDADLRRAMGRLVLTIEETR